MQLASPALEECLIGSILDECVLELVGRLGRDAPRIDEFRVYQFLQSRLKFLVAGRSDRFKKLIGKLTSDHRRDLSYLLSRAQPVQTRGERIVERGGNVAYYRTSVARQDEPGQFLGEQRHSIGA